MKTRKLIFALFAVMFCFMGTGTAEAQDWAELAIRFRELFIKPQTIKKMAEWGPEFGKSCARDTRDFVQCLGCVKTACDKMVHENIFDRINTGPENFLLLPQLFINGVMTILSDPCQKTGRPMCEPLRVPVEVAVPVAEAVAEQVAERVAEKTLQSLLQKLLNGLWDWVPQAPKIDAYDVAGGVLVLSLIGLSAYGVAYLLAAYPQAAAALGLVVLVVGGAVLVYNLAGNMQFNPNGMASLVPNVQNVNNPGGDGAGGNGAPFQFGNVPQLPGIQSPNATGAFINNNVVGRINNQITSYNQEVLPNINQFAAETQTFVQTGVNAAANMASNAVDSIFSVFN